MAVHSKLGASKAERWLNCPGSVALCDTVPPAPSSPYAEEGSAAHGFAEQCLRGGFDAADLIGRRLPDYPDWPMTAEMAEAVQVYVDYCRRLFIDDQGRLPSVETQVEHRFCLDSIDDLLFGTADFMAYHAFDGHLYCVDYKHGAGVPVSVYRNAQVMYYALGAMQEHPDVGQVTIAIVQPRGPGKAVKEWHITDLRILAQYSETLRDGVEATRQPDAPLRSGPWCRWCDAKAADACPRYAAQGTTDFADIRMTAAEFEDVADAALWADIEAQQ